MAIPPGNRTLRERLGALRNLPPFVRLVWETSPGLTIAQGLLRLFRALLPVVILYVGKLIIDEVVALAQSARPGESFAQWKASGELARITMLVAIEFGLAIVSDILTRLVGLVDTLLSERVGTETSLRLMRHAATLDLEDFEDSELQDSLERARRQASGRMTLMAQIFNQVQDMVTIASFAVGLVVYAPWLMVLLALALIPSFLGEAHFNAQSYMLNYHRAPERRELDYVRQTAASVETAKEVKIFGLNPFLIERYRTLAESFFDANKRIAIRRAGWGGLLATIGTVAYYIAYAYIVVAHDPRRILHRRPHLPRRLVPPAAPAAGGAAARLLAGRRARRSTSTTCSRSSRSSPEIDSPPNPRPFPKPIRGGLRLRGRGLPLSGRRALGGAPPLASRCSAGEVLALVGENGAGKTTLVKLLARLYDPDEGRILLDGHDLREYDLDGAARATSA